MTLGQLKCHFDFAESCFRGPVEESKAGGDVGLSVRFEKIGSKGLMKEP